jgi:hypothetical protein
MQRHVLDCQLSPFREFESFNIHTRNRIDRSGLGLFSFIPNAFSVFQNPQVGSHCGCRGLRHS